MVMAKASTLFEVMSKDKVDPDEMMFHMNNDLFKTKTGGMFVTAIIGEYNIINNEITWVNGGHQPVLIRDTKGNFKEFNSESPPLGVVLQKNKSSYLVKKEKLNDHRFFAFTDGLSESLNKKEEEIGIQGSKDIINSNHNQDLKSQLLNITKEVIKISGKNKLSDDLTILAIGK
jgi:Amt family ammonium transporter